MSAIEHFAIYAADSTKLKDFYVTAFGLRVIVDSGGEPPGYFLADDAGMALEILGRPAGTQEVNERWVCHLAISVDDVSAKRSELEHMGLEFESETAVHNDQMKTAFFKDPGGNRCQIVWRRKPLGT
jgi:glyoxylase I family protein